MLVRSSLIYSFTNLLNQIFLFVSQFFIRNIIPPASMGVLNLGLTIRDYVHAISSGVPVGAARELPILLGKKAPNLQSCRDTAYTTTLIESVILILGLSAYLFFFVDPIPENVMAYGIAAALLLFSRMQEMGIIFFQSEMKFIALSRVLFISGLVYSVLPALGAYFFNIKGLLLATLLVEMFRAFWITFNAKKHNIFARLKWDKTEFKDLIHFGLLNKVTDYPNTFFMKLDLLWVSYFFGFEALGIYGFAKSLSLQASEITTRFATVLYSKTLIQFGEGLERKSLSQTMSRFFKIQLLVALPFICWGMTTFMPIAIYHFAPLYQTSIPLMYILMISTFFFSQNNNLFTLWLAEKRLIPNGIVNTVGVIGTAGCYYLTSIVLKINSLNAVALSFAVGLFLFFLVTLFTMGWELWAARETFINLALSIFSVGSISLYYYFFLIDLSHTPFNTWEDYKHWALLSLGLLGVILPIILTGLVSAGIFKKAQS